MNRYTSERNIKLLGVNLKRHLNWIFIFSLMVFAACSSPKKTDETVFLENLMIREHGLFVLMGSKPITLFDMGIEGYENTQPEWIAETKRIWSEYQKTMREYMGPVYAIVKAPIYKTPDHGNSDCGYFVNVLNTAAILKTHYRDFVQVVGEEFDPFVRVKELCEDKESPFWDKVFSNHYLNGLLLGYGSRNSAGFLWVLENDIIVPFENMGGEFPKAHFKEHVSIRDLTIPVMANYGIGDEVLERYKREKVAILKEFEGKDFTETVKKWLGRGATK